MNELRKIADEATPGPWSAVHLHAHCTDQDDEASGLGLKIEGPPEATHRGWLARGGDARFMATFDPQVVGALLDVAEAARLLPRHHDEVGPNPDEARTHECSVCDLCPCPHVFAAAALDRLDALTGRP